MNVSGALVRGLVLGSVAGVVYVANRRAATEPPRLIQWDRVRRLSEQLSRRDQQTESFERIDITQHYRDVVRDCERVIGDYLSQRLPIPLNRVEVFDRPQWIDANIGAFQLLFEPLEVMNRDALRGSTIGSHLFGGVNQAILSGQLGMLMGYLSRRVLGQYDTALLGREPVTTGRLYFVEPNIAMTVRRLGLDVAEFRRWIALHETTHAFEFEAHPWLREYMNGLLVRYFDTVGQDFGRFAFGTGGVTGLAKRVFENRSKPGSPIELFLTEEQREIFNKLQALMCLLEGYSNHVMDVVGNQVLTTYPTMKRQFESRNRDRSVTEKMFTRLTGLDLKLAQYALGERFVNRCCVQVGIDRFNRVWDGPEQLPSLAEIHEPDRWLTRTGL